MNDQSIAFLLLVFYIISNEIRWWLTARDLVKLEAHSRNKA